MASTATNKTQFGGRGFDSLRSPAFRPAPPHRICEVVLAVRGPGGGRRHQVHAAVHVDEVHEVGEVLQVAADVKVGAGLHRGVTHGAGQQETSVCGETKRNR